ncbi:iron complex transport system substrate-binding protein [Pacificibacter maritimus]|uniref:Iron complex transport system substrate-binding protein n=1 Tax=Pacificibacter maritimus TaxID=762213 RepID=A0A3N4UMQ5_9RHOB|nr:siderophore ABC transporter substrate-binding protein [Pacificibacter maritimus]RPE71882.1 iron complex transport system substrate-binding protein [Pacificibacter maritimus]
MKRTLAALALTAIPTFAFAQTVEVETATGPVEVATSPSTVVALDLAAVDTLSALGVDIAGLPSITPPAYMADVFASTSTVGTLFEPDFEALAVMGPDLIIAGGRSQAQVEPLSKIAPTIDMTLADEGLYDQAVSRVTSYGNIFGLEDKAEDLIAQLDTAIAEAKEAAKDQGDVLILLTNGGKVSAYGDDSRFGWLHNTLELEEAYPELSAQNHGEAISFEFIAEVNPDWIFVVDRGAAIGQDGEAAAVTLDNPLVAGTTAAKSDHIVYLDSAPLYLASGGVQSMLGTVNEVKSAMAPATN